MEYVISPVWFYWLNVVDAIRGVALGYLVLFAIGAIVSLVVAWMEDAFEYGIESSVKKIFVSLTIVCVIAVLILVFVPSKETLIEIQVAKLTTYDNVALTVDGVKSVADYIVNAIKTINGG